MCCARYVTITAIIMVTNATFASSSPTGCIESISEHFGVSRLVANLVTTLFLFGYCFGPLFFAPLSEYCEFADLQYLLQGDNTDQFKDGRRFIFYIAFVGYFSFNFLYVYQQEEFNT
jgi:MFS family permease